MNTNSTPKIRVLHTIPMPMRGGIERLLLELLPQLDAGRFEFQFAFTRGRGAHAKEFEESPFKVHDVHYGRGSRWIGVRRLAEIVRKERINLIVSHKYPSNIPSVLAGKLAGGVPVIYHLHCMDHWPGRRQILQDRLLGLNRRRMIAVGEGVRADALKRTGVDSVNIRTVRNGIRPPQDGESDEAWRSRRDRVRLELGAGPGDLVFLFVGRLVTHKRPGDFLTMAERLLERRDGADARPRMWFWVLGDGPMLEELKRAAKGGGCADRIRFIGHDWESQNYYAGADVYVVPSESEGLSLALLEAMAAGLAVITSDAKGNLEAVRDGIEGIVCRIGDIEALVESARSLWADGARLARMQKAARLRSTEFMMSGMVGPIEEIYAEAARAPS